MLIEPTLYAILPQADRDEVLTVNDAVIAAAEVHGSEAGLRLVLEAFAGEAWKRLDAEIQVQRLQALASAAPMLAPHLRGLWNLAVTEADFRELRPPALLLYGTESFPFEAAIADRFRALRPDLRVVVAEKAGHNVHRDRPDIVNTEALSFLAS